MFRNTLSMVAVVATGVLLFSATASTADAQYRYGSGFNSGYGFGYGVGTSRYPRANFNDYFANRLRQRQIQQYYGTPYYPRYDNSYYRRQRQRSYTYRPDYDGRLFRSRYDRYNRGYNRFDDDDRYESRYRDRYDDDRDRRRRSRNRDRD